MIDMISSKEMAQLVLSFGSFTNKELQKISYYLYSWYLTIYGKKLSSTQFEAWIHGPVSPELYNEYKRFGWDIIPRYDGELFIDEETYEFAQKVVNEYSFYEADILEEMTHNELPWKNARKGLKKYESSNRIISDQDIIDHFSKNELYNFFSNSH